MTSLLAFLSGGLVGFTLGLIGGGGSILATPLLLYVVGVSQPHMAIGTSACAVAVNAFANLGSHWRAGNVRWGNALVFALCGLIGALLGSSLGKRFDGQSLLFLFAIVMVIVGVLMLCSKRAGSAKATGGTGHAIHASSPAFTPKLAAVAVGAGLLSGFFGIGGGFLIVPGLLFATDMELLEAIGTSLFAVGTFGIATAANYAVSGLVDWTVAGEYIAGGLIGGWLGMMLACRLAKHRGVLNKIFAAIVFSVSGYMIVRTGGSVVHHA
jgi:uncharacterized protein